MKRNGNGHRPFCIIAARTSSLVIAITKLQTLIAKAVEFIGVVGVVALAAGAAHAAYKDMIELGDRVESINEKSRAINEFVQLTYSG